MAKKKKRQFDTSQIQWDDEELKQRMTERHRAATSKKRRNRIIAVLTIIITFALLGTMCGKDIVRLKSENHALKKQQTALEEQRDELKEELKRVDDQEYIREQARKQLRLLNPGEILFTFEDEEDSKTDAETEESVDKGSEENKDGKDSDG